ncbi:MAG: tetratricopeptide repeat protein [Acidobacteriota bacterium]
MSRSPHAPQSQLAADASPGVLSRSFGPKSWIVGPWQDLLLFVGTPLVIVPIVIGAQFAFSAAQIALIVASFGALGHHLPGMMRAYGDKGLFRRFKKRFILAPLFLIGVCALFTVYELHGLVLIAYLWGVWHGLMQTYGFIRIYDAKTGSPSAWTRRLDHWMCLVWFGAGVTLSPDRMYTVLEHFYRSGGPLLPVATVEVARTLTWIALAVVNVAFFANLANEWRRGNPPNLLKLLLMLTSFGFWFYCSVFVGNILVGVALFEIFHDVQYLSIVWLFNRKRVDKDPTVGEFTSFLFRRSGGMMGFYVGLVFAYGGLYFLPRALASETLSNALMGVLVASALLHFYYDSFIWKVHEAENRETLGLADKSQHGGGVRLPSWALTGARWSVFVLPLAGLAVAQSFGVSEVGDRQRNLAQLMPENPVALYNLGAVLETEGDLDTALAKYERAVTLRPKYAEARYNYGNALRARGEFEAAERQLLAAIEIEPKYPQAYNNLGNLKVQQGELRQAEVYYRRALELDPRLFEASANLAEVQRSRGLLDEAEATYRAYLDLDDDFAPAHRALAGLLGARGEHAASVRHYELAVAEAPDNAELRLELGRAYGLAGRTDEARAALEDAARVAPQSVPVQLALGVAHERAGDAQSAEAAYDRALAIDPQSVAAHHHLGNLLRATGDMERAAGVFERALEIAPDDAETHLQLGVVLATSGRMVDAERQYRRALEQRSDWAVAHFNLANVLAVQEQFGEAVEHYQRALEIDPALAEARTNLEAVRRHLAGA